MKEETESYRPSLENEESLVGDIPQMDKEPAPGKDDSPCDTAIDGNEIEYISGIKLAMVMVAVGLAMFLMLLDTSIIVTAIPRITSDFHSLTDVGWYGSSYLLASCALQPIAGKFYNQFNSKYTFIIFLATFELGSLICGLATSSNMLIIGRAIAGMGASGLMNGGMTIISACVPLHKRALYLGILISGAQFGLLLGPLIGGSLTEYSTWRWCFYINLPIGAFVVLIVFFIHIPEHTIKSPVKGNGREILKSLDLPGFCLFAPSVIMFLLALEWGGSSYPWNSATIIGLFCASACNLVLFLLWEFWKGDSAMIPLSMVRQQVVWTSCLVMFFFFGCLLTTSYYLSIYFQAVQGIAPLLSGVYLLPSILGQMILGIISGFLVGKLGYYLPWSIASGILTSIGSGLMGTFSPSTTTGAWIGYQIIGSMGRGLGMQMPMVAIQNNVPPQAIPISIALMVFSQSLGGAFFLALSQTIFSAGLRDSLPLFAPNVNVQVVIAAGATGLRDVVSNTDLEAVLLAYSKALSHVFYLVTGAAIGTFIFSWGMGWKSIKKSKSTNPGA